MMISSLPVGRTVRRPPRNHPAGARAGDRGPGRLPGAGDRPRHGRDRQDAGATGRRPRRAHRRRAPSTASRPTTTTRRQATTNAQNVLTYNNVLGSRSAASQLQLTYGSYDYNQTTQSFSANYPATTGSPTTAVSATVTSADRSRRRSPSSWGSHLLPSVTATAQAVHRPRDIALVMDLSGSMRMGTLPRVRLLHDLAHHQQSRHPRADLRPLFVEQRRADRADRRTGRRATTVTRSPRATRPPPTPRTP